MRSLILQIPMRRCLRQSWRWVLAAILILTMLGCTGHDNPFDSESSKKHDPFELDAITDYGKITLKWNWPTYPVAGGQRIDIDRFVLFRQALNSSKFDTIYPQPALRVDWVDSIKANGIASDKLYTYRVAAKRGNSWTDTSRPDAALAYPLPLDYDYFGKTIISPPVSFTFPAAICFLGNLKFVAGGGSLRAFDANDVEVACPGIANSTSDMAVINPTNQTSSAYLYVCSKNGRVEVFLWTGVSLMFLGETDAILQPQAAAANSSGDAVYVADSRTQSIFKFQVGKYNATPTNMTTKQEPRRLAVLPNAQLMFCANEGSNSVSVFDLRTETNFKEIPVDERPKDLWVGPDSKLYVACSTGGTVVIIDPSDYDTTKISIGISENVSPLSPQSVTGFADTDMEKRHPGVLAVVASTGLLNAKRAFLLYYSIIDKKLQGHLEVPSEDNLMSASLLARTNVQEGSINIYMLLTKRIWVCQSK